MSPSALFTADGWVPRELCFMLGEQAAAVAGDRFFGAKIGDSYRFAELGTWGRTVLGAVNVGEACAIAAKNVGLLHQGSTLGLHASGRYAELRIGYDGRLGADPRQHLIGTLVVLRKIALLGGAPEAVGVRFSMPHESGADCLEESHGPRLQFCCDYDAIVIDRDVLDLPLTSGHDNGATGRLDLAETTEAIAALLKPLLPYGRANIETIAARERVSTRTVQRKLQAWGFTFKEILDDLRRTEAVKHVLSGEYSALEIALLLGYSDPAHFTRAFRRWTGMPPRDYVRALRSEAL